MEEIKLAAAPNRVDDESDVWEQSPANPYNWSRGKKLYHTSICATYAFTMYVAS
jgi:hypothetical protein